MTITRRDIAFPIQHLSQDMEEPKKYHLDVAFRIVRYIKNESGTCILLDSESKPVLIAYYDSD